MNGRFNNFTLGRLCLAITLVSSLTFSFSAYSAPTKVVSTEVAAGTTTYRVTSSTISAPSGVAVSQAKDITPWKPPVTRLPSNGGLSQAAKGNLIIGIKDLTPVKSTFQGSFNVNTSTLKTGARTMLRTAPVVAQASLGLQALLDSANWYFGDHGELLKPSTGGDPTDPNYWGSAPEGVTYNSTNITGTTSMREALQDVISLGIGDTAKAGVLVGAVNQSPNCLEELRNQCSIKPLAIDSEGRPISGGYYRTVTVVNPTNSISCSSGTYDSARFGCVGSGESQPVTEEDIDSVVESSYDPDPSDWDDLFAYIQPDSFTVDPIPELQLDPVVSTSTDNVTGDVTSTSSKNSYEFDISSNNSTQPKVDVKHKQQDDTYVNGELTGSTTGSTTYPSTNPDNKVPPFAGGSTGTDSGSSTPLELPQFCTWAGIVCDWIGWTQEEPPELPVMNYDGLFHEISIPEETFVITGGAASCPSPIELDLGMFGKPSVSYDSFCELATRAKPLFLTLMAFFSSLIIYRGIV